MFGICSNFEITFCNLQSHYLSSQQSQTGQISGEVISGQLKIENLETTVLTGLVMGINLQRAG